MRIFVSGGTGVIGRPAVERLIAVGHEVTVVARKPERAEQIRAVGAVPVEVGLFDPASLIIAVAGHEVVINLATHIPPPSKAARGAAWAENERLRREASGYLVDAGMSAGASVFVQESLAFAYADGGERFLDEDSALLGDDVSAGISTAEANVARFREGGGRGVVLRFGRFYDATSNYARGQVRAASLGFSTEMGLTEGYQPLVRIDDAADAVVTALTAPSGVYNIVDDGLVTRREIDAILAATMGRKRLWRPLDHTPKSFGPSTELFETSNRASNRRYKDATGWCPAAGGTPAGLKALVRELGYGDRGLRGITRLLLSILGISGLAVGVQALFAPQYFYEEFPFGRGWVAMEPSFNEHLVRDVGAFNLALAAITFVAIAMRSPLAARLSALAWLVFSIPHGMFHVAHLHHMAAGDTIGLVLGTAGPALLALLVLVLPAQAPKRPRSTSATTAPVTEGSFSVPA
jgi:nucleoside-diphosphate-sugar epimerase